MATTTLNLLQLSRINPRLSTEELLNGTFDYNKTPIALPGCKVLIHETHQKRGTWAPHATNRWYISTAPHHYRCHTVYVPKTRAERNAKSVQFFLNKKGIPQNTKSEAVLQAVLKLIDTIKTTKAVVPVTSDTKETSIALQKLADIFLKQTKINNESLRVDNNNNAPPPRVDNNNNDPPPRVEEINNTPPLQVQPSKTQSLTVTSQVQEPETDRAKRIRLRNEMKRATEAA